MWSKKGHFLKIEDKENPEINRKVIYETSRTDSLIKKLAFSGYKSSIIILQLTLTETVSDTDFFREISDECSVLPGVCVTIDGQISFNRTMPEMFEKALNILTGKSPTLLAIVEDIRQTVKSALTPEYSRDRFYQLRNDGEERMAYSYNPDAGKLSPLARAMKEEEEGRPFMGFS